MLFDVQVGIQTGANKVTANHITNKLAQKAQLNRGIFSLKEGIDIFFEGNNAFLNCSKTEIPNFKRISEFEKTLIKPIYSGSELTKWNIGNNNEWLIYMHSPTVEKTPVLIEYLSYYKMILINRSLKNNITYVEPEQYDKFDISEIKKKYSPAGSVQKVMRSKGWYLIFFAREKIYFDKEKILTSSRAETFCYTEKEAFALSGVNYIIFNDSINKEYQKTIQNHSCNSDYLKFINAILNSSYTITFIKESKLNAITGTKLKELIKIYMIDFSNIREVELYNNIVKMANCLIYENNKVVASEIDEKINKMVYELYGLTEDEIKIVEESMK